MKRCKDCNTSLSHLNKGSYCYLHNRKRTEEQALKSFDTHNFSPERWHKERDLAKT